jgi:preprotein translocase subunit SecB
MTFDPRIQVRATFATSSTLRVDISPYTLKEALKVGFGVQRQWRKLPQENHYVSRVTLHVVADTVSDQRVMVAEATMEQVSEVVGYEGQELMDVLEVRLAEILLPYVRAQVASVMMQSGYHHLALPPQLSAGAERAIELTPPATPAAENTTVSAIAEELPS